MSIIENGFPAQRISYKKKTQEWRKKCVDWADNKSYYNYSPVATTVNNMKKNYDLVSGIIHKEDLLPFLNPDNLEGNLYPENIKHHPIINSKLRTLQGEESGRLFDHRIVITNPNALSELEDIKKQQIQARLYQIVMDKSKTEEQAMQELEKMSYYFTYEYQDFREIRANEVINHYWQEQDFPVLFNDGFMDAATVAMEAYQCTVFCGEPTLYKLNPLNIRVFQDGFSNKLEDADMIVIEEYWQPGRIIDTYKEYLTEKDLKYIEEISMGGENADVKDERFRDEHNAITGQIVESVLMGTELYTDELFPETAPNNTAYDLAGNVKVLRVYWKSKRKIRKVKSFDITTGEEVIRIMPEQYVINKDLGETEEIYWVNEAWEGTKIGDEVYVCIRPMQKQYNRLGDISRCHFGIIGTIYNINNSQPYSLVDMAKNYNYLYDVIWNKVTRLIAEDLGKLVNFDLAKIPDNWDIEQVLYTAKTSHLLVSNSFNVGQEGAAKGILAGSMNNNMATITDASLSTVMDQYINILQFCHNEMGTIMGITPQREGQIANRETVGGVERSVLQSSYITEWVFFKHEALKKRVIEAFLEQAKLAFKGRNIKFRYILSDGSMRVMEVDGDEFCECDYGCVTSNSKQAQELNQKLDMLAQAGLQNQAISFSAMMKLYSSASLAEKQRMIEREERQRMEQAQQAQQQAIEQQQQQLQLQMQQEQMKMQQEDMLNQRDNDTKMLIARLQTMSDIEKSQDTYSQKDREKLLETMREFDKKIQLDRERLNLDKQKAKDDKELREKQIEVSRINKTKSSNNK